MPSDGWVVLWTNEHETQDTITVSASLPKKERGSVSALVTWQWPKKERIFFYANVTWHWSKTKRIRVTNCSCIILIQLSFTNKWLPPATSILSRSTMAHNTLASWGKLTCTDYIDFGKCQERFVWLSWSKIDYMDEQFKMLTRYLKQ